MMKKIFTSHSLRSNKALQPLKFFVVVQNHHTHELVIT